MAKKPTKAKDQAKQNRASTSVPAPTPTTSLPTSVETKPVDPHFLAVTSVPLPASIPRWKRAYNSKSRKIVAKILVYKLAGLRSPEIAKKLKTSPETVRHYLWLAGKNGWLSAEGTELADPAEDLVYNSATKIVRNINHSLDGKFLMPQQFEMTVDAAKGIGLFKTHQATKIEGSMAIPALEVNIQMPALSSPLPAPDVNQMGGKGNYLEGEVNGNSDR